MIEVHPSAVVDSSAWLGDDVKIGPNCVIERNVHIGDGTVLDANVVICKGVRLGSRNHLFSNCTIGAYPQILGLGMDAEVGGLVIGDRNTIREQVTIHPSMYPQGATRIGSDNLLMIGVHIGHDCTVEDKTVLSNYVQISGHCKIETGVWLSGMVTIHQFVTIGKWVYGAALAGINHDVPPFMIVSGHYPPVIRGVNKRGMTRAGLSDEQQAKVAEAYKKIYRRKGALLDNVKALEADLSAAASAKAEDGLDENVQAIIDAINRSSQQRFGRYLELSRHSGR
jgi:UDP-N-acetylglucosamine acyltransferase